MSSNPQMNEPQSMPEDRRKQADCDTCRWYGGCLSCGRVRSCGACRCDGCKNYNHYEVKQ